jgi:hypothetical protein
MTRTVDVKADGETVDVEVEELGPLEVMTWAAKAPDQLKNAEKEVEVDVEVLNFMVDLATEQTVMTRDLLNELDKEELGRFLGAVVAYSFGEEADLERDEPEEIDFESDEFFSLDEWK